MLVYRTAGGGGWKDPFDRPVEKVEADVAKGLVSAEKAKADYGVVFGEADSVGQPVIDEVATRLLRAEMAKARKAPLSMIDRGEGYEKMLRGEHRPRMR